MKVRGIVALALALFAAPAGAWWNEDWQFRKELTVDAGPEGLAVDEPLADVPVLVRLHLGNFGYFDDVAPDGADIRFFGDEDATPLVHRLERFDPVNRIGLLWVRVPRVAPAQVQRVNMYYGNPEAASSADAAGFFDRDTAVALDFAGGATRDLTAYGNQPVRADVLPEPAGLVGDGIRFSGAQRLEFGSSPSLDFALEQGRTVSLWLRLEQPQGSAVLLEQPDGSGGLVRLQLTGTDLSIVQFGAGGVATGAPVTGSATLPVGEWTHVAQVADAQGVRVYVNGARALEAPALFAAGAAGIAVGDASADGAAGIAVGDASADGQALDGVLVDELQVAKVARPESWLRAVTANQGMEQKGVAAGGDESKESGESEGHFVTTLRNVQWSGLEGYVIVLCVFMAIFSWYVMITKALVTEQIRSANAKFMRWFREMGPMGGTESTDFGDGRQFEPSTLAELYSLGIAEIDQRMQRVYIDPAGEPRTPASMSRASLESIRALLAGQNVRISQRMGNLMVLLTLAIAGGPFLGLLGTVVGVMVTFAGIAASGDVNINAIAPGIAAALVATVAGLGVAIPALFGYNYVSSRIKEVITENNVFLEEFTAAANETYANPEHHAG